MAKVQLKKVSTGISGLDEILKGGLISNRSYLVRGGPGSGKTTLGLHFLCKGAQNGEKVLYITLEESEGNLRTNAEIRGFDLKGVEFLDLSPSSSFFAEVETYDIFSPAEVERDPITQKIIQKVNELKPSRVFIDPLTQFRYLTSDVFQFRRQVLSFLRFLVENGATVLFTSEGSLDAPDDDLQFMSDGIIDIVVNRHLRSISVKKFRGSDFLEGHHDMRLSTTGMVVFPRVQIKEERKKIELKQISSGVPDLDKLLGGGIEKGTVTIFSGPSGVGKTTLGMQFMKTAAEIGENSVIYSFEEEIGIMTQRAEAIGIPIRSMIERQKLSIFKVDPLQWTADEFAQLVRQHVENNNIKVIMLDSISGYKLAVKGKDLTGHLHALTQFLKNMGVAVLLIAETSSITGDFKITDANISYLGDNIIFLRYLEIEGQLRRAIGVLKKRLSDFEKNLREFLITDQGIKVGKPLTELRGILKGEPEWIKPKEK